MTNGEGQNVLAMEATVVRSCGSPARRYTVTLSGVDGAQVMLNGVPAVIVSGPENVNAFCADTMEARATPRSDE